MKGAWKIESNHIVFQTENELLHPNAEELFAVVNSLPSNFSEEYECEDIHSAFPDVRFSTIGIFGWIFLVMIEGIFFWNCIVTGEIKGCL